MRRMRVCARPIIAFAAGNLSKTLIEIEAFARTLCARRRSRTRRGGLRFARFFFRRAPCVWRAARSFLRSLAWTGRLRRRSRNGWLAARRLFARLRRSRTALALARSRRVQPPLILQRGLVFRILVSRPEPGDFQRPHSIRSAFLRRKAILTRRIESVLEGFQALPRPNSHGMEIW